MLRKWLASDYQLAPSSHQRKLFALHLLLAKKKSENFLFYLKDQKFSDETFHQSQQRIKG